MAKFYDLVGYVEEQETRAGVWEEVKLEKPYNGDIIRNTRRLESGESINDNVVITNVISIVADPYAYQHFFAIRYVRWCGVLWKVTNVEVQRPRLLLTLGGVYNGQPSEASRPFVQNTRI